MLFSDITMLDDTFTPREHRYVGVREGRIAYIGDAPPAESFGEVYPGHKKLLMPGLYNAHTHLPMTLLRGYGENMALSRWLNEKIFPFEAKMTGEDVYWGALLGLAEMMRFGAVAAKEMYYYGEALCQAVLEAGMKAAVSVATLCFTDAHLQELPVYGEARELFASFHGAGDGRLRVDCSLHGEYTSTSRVAGELADLCRELGAGMHIHVSETREEHEGCLTRHGKTPVRYLCDLGLFDGSATAAHCVWVTEEDMDILGEKGVTVASCPVSNLKIASGVAPAARMLEKGVSVALGTDGVASNNNHDLFEEMKLFSILQKHRTGDAAAVGAQQALYAATRAGALAQGRADSGLIRPGYCADLAVLDLDAPHLEPCHDLCAAAVYAASGHDICLTMADGRVLYREGEYPTLDLERIVWEVNRRREWILEELRR